MGLGVILEAPKIFSIPVAAVFVGVVIEAACTLLLFGFDEGISGSQQAKIIGLETQLAPRSLRNEDISAFNRALTTLSGANVDVYIFPSRTPDTIPLGRAIAAVLKQAGWDIFRIETATGGQYFLGVGVWMKADADDRVKKAQAALIRLLAPFNPNPNPDMRVAAGAFAVDGVAPGLPDWTRVPAPLAVLIGSKP